MRANCKALFEGKSGTMLGLTCVLISFCTMAQAQSGGSCETPSWQ